VDDVRVVQSLYLNNRFDSDIIKDEIAEIICSRIEGLKLHRGTTMSDYVNKDLMYYHDLAKIPGKE
jgi:hypothetical protein